MGKKEEMSEVTTEPKKKRKSVGPTKAELREKVEQLEGVKDEQSKQSFSPEAMALITTGLFSVVEGITKLPFTQTDEALKSGFDACLSDCMTTYVAPNMGYYGPLMNFGAMCLMITIQALDKKKEQQKEQLEKKKTDEPQK